MSMSMWFDESDALAELIPYESYVSRWQSVERIPAPQPAVMPRASIVDPLPPAPRPTGPMCVRIGSHGVSYEPCDPFGVWQNGYGENGIGFSGSVWFFAFLLLMAFLLFRK